MSGGSRTLSVVHRMLFRPCSGAHVRLACNAPVGLAGMAGVPAQTPTRMTAEMRAPLPRLLQRRRWWRRQLGRQQRPAIQKMGIPRQATLSQRRRRCRGRGTLSRLAGTVS